MFRFLVKHKHVPANPAADLELPRVARQLPRHALTIDEVERLMLVPDVTHPMGLRLRAILEFLYSTGVRRTELIRVDVADVDFGHGTVHVRDGKGGKDRFVPIGDRALLWVRKYLAEVRPLFVVDMSTTLFVANNGEPLSKPWLSQLVADAIDDADIGKKGSCHMLRHTMATLMLEGGADIRYIQAMLGHAHMSTTEIYTHVAIGMLKKVHERTHPAKLTRLEEVTP
jgi:integrase/recombinase XerD